ncbi:MAG: hypothetical protein ACKO2F_07570 [Cyanobacteriota bacterium]
MAIRTLLFTLTLGLTMAAPTAGLAQATDGAGTAGRATLTTGTTEAKAYGDWNGTYQNTGVNLQSARRVEDGFIVRVKRLIKPGSDSAKEFARNIPVVSTAANLVTLGLFNRALKSDGEAVRATWMTMNCTNKTFNVTGDGYSWQNVYKDQYGQAEDLYYNLCVSNDPAVPARYLSLAPADADMIQGANVGR